MFEQTSMAPARAATRPRQRWRVHCVVCLATALAARRSVCTPRPKPATRHTTAATRFVFNLRTKPWGMHSVLRAAVSCCWQWFCMSRRAPAFGCGLIGSWRKLARISVCNLGRQTLGRVLLSCSSGVARNTILKLRLTCLCGGLRLARDAIRR